MPNRSRQKGDRKERQVRDMHQEMLVPCDRVPLSGAAGGEFGSDLHLHVPGMVRFWQGEVKARAGGEGWKTVEEWLGTNDVLFLLKDRADPLVVLPWTSYAGLIRRLISAIDAARESREQPLRFESVRAPVEREADGDGPLSGV